MIAFEELFPFGDLTRLLQQLQTEEKKLSSGRESFSQKYKETLKEEIALIADLKKQLQGIGTVSLKGDGLAKVGEEVDKVGKKIQGYRDLINTLTSAEAANSASIEKLRGTLAQLKAQYDKLDPTMEGFAATQQELAQKSMYVKQAMDAQLSAMREANKTVKHAAGSYNELVDANRKLHERLASMPNVYEKGTKAINENNKAAESLRKQIKENEKALKSYQDLLAKEKPLKPEKQAPIKPEVIGQYNKLNAETIKLRASLKSLDNAFDSTTGKINKHNSVAVALQAQIQKNDRALKAMDANMGLYQRNVGNYSSAFSGLGSALVQFTGIAGGVDLAVTAITKSFEVISSFERYRSVIGFASKDTAEFNANLAFLENIANSTGTEIEVLYKKYASFAIAAREANYSQKQTQEIFGSVIRAGGALKMSNEGIELSLKALEQMLSKGKISAEELRQQLGDHLPGAMQLFSKGLGISVEKLGDMMKAGEILSADALPKFAAQLDKTFGAAAQTNVNTISGSFNRMTNQLKLFIDEFAQSSKIASFFSSINNGIANVLKGMRDAIKSNDWMVYMGAFVANPINGLRMLNQRGQNPTTPTVDRNNLTGFSGLSAEQRKQNIIRIDYANQENKLRLEKMKIGSKEFYQLKDQIEKEDKLLANMIKTHEKLVLAKKGTAKATKEESNDVKDLRKEYNALREELRKGTVKNKDYAKTDEGAAKSKRYNELKAQLKDIDVAAGISNPAKLKEERTELEKITDQLEKIGRLLSNEIISDFEKNKVVNLPKDRVREWYKLYDLLVQLEKQFGINIPASVKQTKEALDNVFFKEGLENFGSQNVYSSDPTAQLSVIAPDVDMKDPKPEKVDKNDLSAEIKSRALDRAELERRFSEDLIRMKKEEKDKLRQLQIEQQEAERQDIKDRRDALKQEIADRINAYKDEEDKKQAMRELAAQTAINISGSLFELQNAYRERDIAQIEKKRDFELSLVQNNAVAQKAIEEKAAREIREIRIKQARADKAAALFEITLNTAVAIAKVWGQTGIGGTLAQIAPIAMGIVQAAVVLAKPLPEFAKGTQDAPEGPALVGEKGPELRESKGKFYYHDKPTITNLRRGDKIYTATETARMFRDSMITDKIDRQFSNDTRGISNTQAINYQLDTTSIIEGLGKKFSEALANQPYWKEVLDKDEVAKVLVSKNQMTKYYGKKHF